MKYQWDFEITTENEFKDVESQHHNLWGTDPLQAFVTYSGTQTEAIKDWLDDNNICYNVYETENFYIVEPIIDIRNWDSLYNQYESYLAHLDELLYNYEREHKNEKN